MTRRVRRVVITLVCVVVGLGLMVYPFLSNYLYEHRQQDVIFNYQQEVEGLEDNRVEQALADAQSYNRALQSKRFTITEPFDPEVIRSELGSDYVQVLNLGGDGLMGYIEIPAISVYLPIYHGTSEQVLSSGVGHLENTSLPIGGESTHAVLSAHSGLSDKKLFTDLVLLQEGDQFYIHVLNRTLAYQVDRIQVVLPYETQALQITTGEDYVTLVTCTPYGINSHRLLVRGTAVEYVPEQKQTQQTAQTQQSSPWMRQYLHAVLAGTVVLLIVVLAAALLSRRRDHE